MKAYKGFNEDMTCRGFQFEEGKTYEHEGEVKLCESGFHACEDPLNIFEYYAPANSEFHEVELDGVSNKRGRDTKVVAKKITIGARLSIDKIIKDCIKFRFSKLEKELENSGNNGAATNSGDYGAASNSGDNGAATNSGYKGAASNSGDNGAASNSGYKGAATNSGDNGVATNSGDWGAAETSGKHSIAMSVGCNSKARGALGTWIVLAERDEWNGEGCPIKDVKAFKVDGEQVKADTWYMLKNGVLTETGNEKD